MRRCKKASARTWEFILIESRARGHTRTETSRKDVNMLMKNRPFEVVRGMWRMLNGKKTDVEFSEELTNGYFGDHDAWSVHEQASAPETRHPHEE
jgi:hypothetical protein